MLHISRISPLAMSACSLHLKTGIFNTYIDEILAVSNLRFSKWFVTLVGNRSEQ